MPPPDSGVPRPCTPAPRHGSATAVLAHVLAQLALPVLQARVEHAQLDDGRGIGLAKALAPAFRAVDGAGQVTFCRGGLGFGARAVLSCGCTRRWVCRRAVGSSQASLRAAEGGSANARRDE